MIFYVNGKYLPESKAKIDVRDIGLLRGYGVFDYFVTYNNKPFLFERHIDRFFNSAKLSGLQIGKSKEQIKTIILSTLSKNRNGKEKSVRILATGGVGNISTEASNNPSLIVIVENRHPYPDSLYTKGAKAITYKHQRPHPEVKSLDYSEAIKALALAKKDHSIEAIYYDEKTKEVSEATTSNVFIVKKDKIYTTETKILNGMTRDLVINLCKDFNPVRYINMKLSDLLSANEVFLTSSNKEVMPITTVDNKKIGDGKVGHWTKMVMDAYCSYSKNEIVGK